mmetsp:Transcript_11305/g.13340  ORF Transcript_11305/g.13340 Transcript_11305/m.13340 type:complete len:100 (+) Transcript_11305:28-327(+)
MAAVRQQGTFNFKEPEELAFEPFSSNQYEEYFEEATEESLRQYILANAEKFRQVMLQDLGELQREYDNLGSKVSDAEQKNQELGLAGQRIKDRFDEANG